MSKPSPSASVGTATAIFTSNEPASVDLGSYLPPSRENSQPGSNSQGSVVFGLNSNSNFNDGGIDTTSSHQGGFSSGGISGHQGHRSHERSDVGTTSGNQPNFGAVSNNQGGFVSGTQFQGGNEHKFGVAANDRGDGFATGTQFQGGNVHKFGVAANDRGDGFATGTHFGGSQSSFEVKESSRGNAPSLDVGPFDARVESLGQAGFSTGVSESGHGGHFDDDEHTSHGINSGSRQSNLGLGSSSVGNNKQHALTFESTSSNGDNDGHHEGYSGSRRSDDNEDNFSKGRIHPRFSGRKGGYGGSRRSSCKYLIWKY